MPNVGDIARYTLTEQDALEINRRREDAQHHLKAHRERSDGSQIHVGNRAKPGEVYPLVVTRVWDGESVNGQVLLDGNDTYWATSRVHGFDPGCWH